MKTSKPPVSIESHPGVIEKRAEITAVATRLKQAELREAAARQRLRDLGPVRITTAAADAKKATAAAKVRKLLAGGVVSSADPASQLSAAEAEQSLLREAQSVLATELRQIIGEISDEFTTDYLEPLIKTDTVQIYEHLALAAAAMARVRGRATDAARLGYRVSSAHCPDLIPGSAWGLGDPSSAGSELWRMRRRLVEQGWLK
jgi:hypothetical protein